MGRHWRGLVTTVGQHGQWTETFAGREDFLGADPSEVGQAALAAVPRRAR